MYLLSGFTHIRRPTYYPKVVCHWSSATRRSVKEARNISVLSGERKRRHTSESDSEQTTRRDVPSVARGRKMERKGSCVLSLRKRDREVGNTPTGNRTHRNYERPVRDFIGPCLWWPPNAFSSRFPNNFIFSIECILFLRIAKPYCRVKRERPVGDTSMQMLSSLTRLEIYLAFYRFLWKKNNDNNNSN